MEAEVREGNRTVRFGEFEADLHSGEVRKSGKRIKLQDQPFKILQVLLERQGALVTREELQSRIWPEDNFGDFDHAVNVAVGKLRTALGDSADKPSFIETVPRRGYRFVARLEVSPPEIQADPVLPGTPSIKFVHGHWLGLLVLVAVTSGILLGLGTFLGRRASRRQQPAFQRLTARRGTVYAARFAPDGRSVIYAASWNSEAMGLFLTDPKIPGARELGLSNTQLLAVSSLGELAVLQPAEHRFLLTLRGTLGRLPLAGGSPRQIAENVDWADWTPDGKTLALVREVAGKQYLEFPGGHVLFETAGWMSHLRISPNGDQIAFLEHPMTPDDRGVVQIVDLAGRTRTLSTGWESTEGLAWSPDGREIWFSAAQSGLERQIYAVDMSGHQRLIFGAPGGITLQDIASDGRVLLTRDEQRIGMMALAPGASRERDLSWQDWSIPVDISADGKTVLFDEQGMESGANYTVALRDTQGSPPISLGEGVANGLSPDGKWTTTILSNEMILLPTGAGPARPLYRGEIQRYWHGSRWFPDGRQIIFAGNRAGEAVRCFVQTIDGGKPHPVTPEGINSCQVSPDGKWVSGTAVADSTSRLYRLENGEQRTIPGLLPGESFVWTSDPEHMYTWTAKEMPLKIYRLAITSGTRDFFRELSPPDVSGLNDISHIHFSSNGKAYVYSFNRLLSELYLVKGLE